MAATGNATSAQGQFWERVFLKHKCILFTARVPKARVLWTVCTSASGKPFPKIVPVRKLHSLRLPCAQKNFGEKKFQKKIFFSFFFENINVFKNTNIIINTHFFANTNFFEKYFFFENPNCKKNCQIEACGLLFGNVIPEQ